MNQGPPAQPGNTISPDLYRQYFSSLQQLMPDGTWTNQRASIPPPYSPTTVDHTASENPLYSMPNSTSPSKSSKSHNSTTLQTPLLPKTKKTPKNQDYVVWCIYMLCLVDIGFFIWEMVKNNKFEPFSVNPMFGPSATTLLDLGAKWVPLIRSGQYWRFISPIVLHGGIIHLIANLAFQFFFGLELERLMGWWRILILYILSGIGGNLASCIFLPEMLEVGASGALFGLLGATFARLILFWGYLNSPCRTLIFSLLSLILSLAFGLLPGIDNFAHIGGLLVGFPLSLTLIATIKKTKISKVKSRLCGTIGILFSLGILVFGFVYFFLYPDNQIFCGWCKYFNCIDLSFINNGPNYCIEKGPPPPGNWTFTFTK